MATEVISTIRASGGDYTTLSAWEAGEQRNLVTADEIAVAVCYNDWPSGLSDSINIAGWTTDATRYIRVTVAEGHRHNGTPGTGFHLRQATSGSSLFLVQHAGTRIEWIDGVQQSTASSKFCFRAFGSAATGVIFDRCLGSNQSSTSANAAFMEDSLAKAEPRQCLAYSSITGFGTIEAKSCIAVGCTTGFGGTGNRAAYNCVAYNCTTDYAASWGFAGLGSNNASSGTAATGASPEGGGVNNITSAAFVNAASNDFHLSSGSVLRGAGVNLYSTFTTDIDGDTWPSSGAWDIGFDYYVAAGGLTINSITASSITSSGAAITLGLTR